MNNINEETWPKEILVTLLLAVKRDIEGADKYVEFAIKEIKQYCLQKRLIDLEKIDEDLTYYFNPYAQELNNNNYDGDSMIKSRIAAIRKKLI